MGAAQAFGPNLRQARLLRGISLYEIAEQSKVGVELWEDMEQDDFTRWPTGLYARAYVREYAEIVGLDPAAAVDEFCRSFPQGDRRAERIVRSQAELIQHSLVWHDDPLPEGRGDRRASAATMTRELLHAPRVARLVAAALDLMAVVVIATATAMATPLRFWPALAIGAVLYHGGSLAVEGCTPGAWAIDAFLSVRPRRDSGPRERVFRRLHGTSRG